MSSAVNSHAFLAVLIAASSLTYLAVERPMQDAGRRAARWLDTPFGQEQVLAGRTRAAAG